MFFWLGRNAVSCSKVIRKRFSTISNSSSKLPLKIIPNIKSFEAILENPDLLYVDKSRFIMEILSEDTVQITRPSRWGKSLNMQMIESFFQPAFSPEGMIIEDKIKKEQFSKMLIASENISKNPFTYEIKKTSMIDLQGTVPVVHLSFVDIIEKTNDGIHQSFMVPLRKMIKKHEYLLRSNKLIGILREDLLEEILNDEFRNPTCYDIIDGLDSLLTALNIHHDKRPILLIDEYDKTFISAKMGSPELYEYCINLFVHMFSIVKYQNKLIELSIFTGVNCIPIDGSFSGLNNVRYDSLYDKSYSEHFGFTETDIDLLVDKANALYHQNLNKTKLKEKISLCDNGYNIYDKMIYNPFSVMNCLYSLIQGTENPFKNYWANFDYPSLFLNSLETVPTKRYIDTLFKEDMVEFYSESDTNIRGISSNENIFLTIMQDSGYLKRIPETFKFNIQNNEIKFELYRIWLKRHSDDLFKVFIKPEEFENPEKFLKVFQENALPFFKADENPEYFFQSLLYLNLNKKGLNVILEKKTDDHKRIEIEITPDESLDKINEIVYIIEIKNQGSKSEGSGINDGLLQIFRKNYAVYELIEEKSFKIFVLRVVSFGYNEHSGWKISMAELRFTRENLHRVINSFFLNNKERINLFEELRYHSFSSFIG